MKNIREDVFSNVKIKTPKVSNVSLQGIGTVKESWNSLPGLPSDEIM